MKDQDLLRREIAKKLIAVALLAVMLALSVTVLDRAASDPARYERTLASLDEKEATVLKMTGASAAVSTAIAAVPGDATTPVAEELADLASCFVFILTVIVVEKFLVAVIGHVAFAYLIPAACLLAAAGIVLRMRLLKQWAVKLGLFGLIMCLVIPFSMGAADIIEKTVDTDYEQTIEQAQQITEEISESTDEEGNFLTKAWGKITGGISGLADRGEELFVNILESIAMMLATSCIIPIAVLLIAFWAIKMLFGVQITIPTDICGKLFGRFRRNRQPDV